MSRITGNYLDGLVRSRSETRDAIVTVALVNGRYTVTDPVTGGTYKAATSLTTAIAVGKRVVVRHNASGRSTGRVPEIIGVSQDSGNGVVSGELALDAPVTGETVTRMPELPVTLVAGGAATVVTIYGVGLSSAITYGDAGITNDAAQVTSDNAITIRPKASGAVAKGRYTATVAGVVIPDFFEVV